MQTVPQRATDAKFIASIEGFRGNLFKLGRLVRHDWFSVSESGHQRAHDRYLFLFKARILVTKVKRIAGDRSVFLLRTVIRIPETSLENPEHPKKIEFRHIETETHPNFPIIIEAKTTETKDAWLEEVGKHVLDTASVDDLLFDDELRIVSEDGEEVEEGRATCSPDPDELEQVVEFPEDSGRIVPINLEEDIGDLPATIGKQARSKGEEESSPLPARKKARADLLETEYLEVQETGENAHNPDSFQLSVADNENSSNIIKQVDADSHAKETLTCAQSVEEIQETDIVTAVQKPEKEGEAEQRQEQIDREANQKAEEEAIRKEIEELGEDGVSANKAKKGAAKKSGKKSKKSVTKTHSEEQPGEGETQQEVREPQAEKEQLASKDPELADQEEEVVQDSDLKKTPSEEEAEAGTEQVSKKEKTDSKKAEKDAAAEKEAAAKKTAKKEAAAKIKAEEEAAVKAKSETESAKKAEADKEAARQKASEEAAELKASEEAATKEAAQQKAKTDAAKKQKEQETAAKQATEAKAKREEAQQREKQEAASREAKQKAEQQKAAQQAQNMSRKASMVDSPTGGPRPVFTKTLIGAVVEPGEQAVFVCDVTHTTPCDLLWLKDNAKMEDKLMDRVAQTEENGTYQLKISNCRSEDTGVYTAKATDMEGASSTSSAQLMVQELSAEERQDRLADKTPFFSVSLRDTTVIEGTNLSYVVHASGDPMPTVTFMKNGAPIVEDARLQIHSDMTQGHHELLINHVVLGDKGDYSCVAVNSGGEASCHGLMDVMEDKDDIEPMHGKGSLLQEGEKADFKWFRDGQEFDPIERFNVHYKDDEDTLALVFQSVTPEDAGLYTCVASTSCGKISCSAELTVEGSVKKLAKEPMHPVILENLSDVSASNGSTLFLECKINGFPVPVLHWTRNGEWVKVCGRVKQLWDEDSCVSLIVKTINESDAGEYKVVATNDLGSAETTCKVVIRAGPKFHQMQREVGCSVGEEMRYTVEVEGEPRPVLTWFKDGKEIEESLRVRFTSDDEGAYTFTIFSMEENDCGTYAVTATNDMGQRTENFKIVCDSPPSITRGLDRETEKKLGNDHTFEVRVTGAPSPTATWYKNDNEIVATDRIRMTRDETFYMLKLRNLERGDKGVYKVVVSNALGEDESTGFFTIRAPPQFITPIKDAYAPECDLNAIIFCEFCAHPKPTVRWTFKDLPIRPETPGFTLKYTDYSTTLIIHEAIPAFVGKYGLTLANEYGEISDRARLRLHEPPVITEPLTAVEFLEHNTEHFVFKATGVPPPEIKWIKDGHQYTPDDERVKTFMQGDDTFYLSIEDALTQDSGEYQATLTNVEGTCHTEGSIIVNTPPHIVASNFKDGISVVAAHPLTLEVVAHAVPQAEATWFLNNEEIKESEEDVKMEFDGTKYTLQRGVWDPEHCGEYTCKLKNKIKENSEVGTINIYEREARVRRPLTDIWVKQFDTATLKCQIVGDPVPTVEWLRDGEPIPDGKYQVTDDEAKHWQTLVFEDVKEADKCTFTVKGANEHGECETMCAMGIYVVPEPSKMELLTVDYAGEILISCHIHAIPPPEVVWYHDGVELEDCEHTRYQRVEDYEDYSIFLSNAVLEDGGTYSLRATNVGGEAEQQTELHVHRIKPTIKVPLVTREVCLEDEVTFEVICRGLPLPDTTWFHNEVEQTADTPNVVIERVANDTHRITFKDLTMEDYGKVEVKALSVAGETSCHCQLTQKSVECSFLEPFETVSRGGEGEDVTLSVLVRASPRPVITWTRDGDVVTETENLLLKVEKVNFSDLRLSLTMVEAANTLSGQFRCKIKNMVNEAVTETALVIKPRCKAPKIKKKPKDLQVAEKERAIFKVKVEGFPKPEVQWLKDGRELRQTDVIHNGVTGDGLFFLEFRHCHPDDAGSYTMTAVNSQGKTDAVLRLTVLPPPSKPEFLQGLRATKVIVGYPCRMEMKCDGFPEPTVTWMKDGEPLKLDRHHIKMTTLEDGTTVLQIDEATAADAGEYSCVLSNGGGDTTSSAVLTVADHTRTDGQPDGPPVFDSPLKDVTADEGKTLLLPVSIRGGPVPDLKWYKDGAELCIAPRTYFTYDGDRAFLEMTPCESADSGTYRCVLTNAAGETVETECEVTVRKCFSAPTFTQGFHGVQQMPGLDLRLSVSVDGVPRPDLTWTKDGKKLDLSKNERLRIRREGEATTLVVRACVYGDAGVYKVVATNREGKADHEGGVEVVDEIDPDRKNEAPSFLKSIGDQEVFENDTARFKAIVKGKPIPEFQWQKNGKPIAETTRITSERDRDGIIRLVISHVEESDVGKYSLKVWNSLGKTHCSGKLTCECISKKTRRPLGDEYQGWDKVKAAGAPMPLPDRPYISALSDRRVTVSWNPHIAQGAQPPTTYQVEMCESPEGEWYTARTGIRGTSVDLTNLGPKCDYKFRIRNENRQGVSEPSPYVTTHRNKLEVPVLNYEPHLDLNLESQDTGPYVPKGFVLDLLPNGCHFAPPRFLRLETDVQYGQKGFNGSVKWLAYGYPTPKIRFMHNGTALPTNDSTTRNTHIQEASGNVMLFLDKCTDKHTGNYECIATNEYGESKQRIKFEMSDFPRVTQHLQETHLRSQATGRIMCRIAGAPACEVHWYKDWKPLQTSFRIKPQFIEPDMYILNFNGAILRDTGLYSLCAVNVAGTAASSCLLQIVDEELDSFVWTGPGRGRHVELNRRRGALEDHFDIGDELGRGTQGASYHCVEHYTGLNFSAKSMWGDGDYKQWMSHEFEMMNLTNSCRRIARLYDAYESPHHMSLVMELCGGGPLLTHMTQQQWTTEYEVAHYTGQLLEAVEYMHDRCMAHLGINIGDILLTRPNGTDIKLIDLSLARPIRAGNLQPLDYGMPEYVAPEVVLGTGVGYAADMWSVGIVVYLMLSGTSPFRGSNDRSTLNKVKAGELKFDSDAFKGISKEAKDFLAKLLQFKPAQRLDVKQAQAHPWLYKTQLQPRDPHKINTDRLRTYAAKYKDWYANASCRRWYRRRPLSSAFTHPSKMVYPPGEVYTPPDSPERETVEQSLENYEVPHKDLSYELDPISSDSNYQQGPDTYLLQLRDVDFPCRLRQYMKIAADRSPVYAANVRENLYDYSRIPAVHERRRFTDMMDEEIDDERRRTVVDRYSSGFVRQKAILSSLELAPLPKTSNGTVALPKRVVNEVRTRPEDKKEKKKKKKRDHSSDVAVVEDVDEGLMMAPLLREKPGVQCVGGSKSVLLTVLATGDPLPIVQWFRNDVILAADSHLDINEEKVSSDTVRATMLVRTSRENDVGSYKVVARNANGQASHRFRLVLSCLPPPPDSPELVAASDTAVLLSWRPPYDDGGSPIAAYGLQQKAAGETDWKLLDDTVPIEKYLASELLPNTLYQFRLAALNALGWSEYSIGSVSIRTSSPGCPRLNAPPGMSILEQRDFARQDPTPLDYEREKKPVKIVSGEDAEKHAKQYQFVDELFRGEFSTICRAVKKVGDKNRLYAVKVLVNENRDEQVRLEHDILKSLQHIRIVTLYEAVALPNFTLLVQELLSGLDIVTFLASKHDYSEHTVTTVLTQVLDGLSYLQWRGICHLDLQPGNIVVTSPRQLSVKLVDFASARRVSSTGSTVPVNGLTAFTAPEVLFENKAFPTTDVWSLGVLAYTLLTGRTPFTGETEEDVRDNIQCVRYRFEYLPSSTTQEATRFLMLIFKRSPEKRPTIGQCLEHRWLEETDFVVKKKERATIMSNRIRHFNTLYMKMKGAKATSNKDLLSFAGLLPKE